MRNEYVEQREGGYYVAGSRVSLDSIVYSFLRGESAESIVDSYPSLTLEQVFGALAYYLANRETVESYLEAERTAFGRMREESRRRHPLLYAKIESARQANPRE